MNELTSYKVPKVAGTSNPTHSPSEIANTGARTREDSLGVHTGEESVPTGEDSAATIDVTAKSV